MTTALVHFNHTVRDGRITWPDMRQTQWKPNYGDMLVCAALLRQVELGPTIRIGFGNTLRQKVARALIRGSTYLHHKMDFAAVNRTLDSIDAPVTIVGLGAQNPEPEAGFLDGNAGARDFIARLNERGHSISVRGAFTARVVERLGGRNIRVTGCPSLFHGPACPQVEPGPRLATRDRRIGVSLHTGLQQNIFCAAPAAARAAHVRTIRYAIDDCAEAVLFEQGVSDEFRVADAGLPIEERLRAASGILARIDPHGVLRPEELVAHMCSVTSVEEWIDRAGRLDAMTGFRFHGNMVALLQGRPCHYQVYDSRIREFCELYRLPFQDVREDWRAPHEAMLTHDWAETNCALAACHAEMARFYDENGYRFLVAGPAPPSA